MRWTFLGALLGAILFGGCDRISILSPTASSGQQQSQDQPDPCPPPCPTPTTTPGQTANPTTFSCPLANQSSCTATWDGGLAFEIHTTCAATGATQAVDTTTGPHASGIVMDPIIGAGGPHSCTFELVGTGLSTTQNFQT